jgi:hypothetical protein
MSKFKWTDERQNYCLCSSSLNNVHFLRWAGAVKGDWPQCLPLWRCCAASFINKLQNTPYIYHLFTSYIRKTHTQKGRSSTKFVFFKDFVPRRPDKKEGIWGERRSWYTITEWDSTAVKHQTRFQDVRSSNPDQVLEPPLIFIYFGFIVLFK